MALRVYLSQNELNDKVGTVGNWYARVDNLPPIEIDELADLIKEHNIGFSKGSIVGILKDMVTIIRRQVLNGQPVKIGDLAIFKASVENRGGWSDLKDVSLRVGGEKDNIQAIRLLATATGDFTKQELSKDGRLVLDRQSAALVAAAGGDPNGSGSGSDNTGNQGGSGSGDGGSGQQTTTGFAITISRTGVGSATVTSGGNAVTSGSSLAEDAEVEITITPAEGQTPTATINGSSIELTDDSGTFTGSFAMPGQASTLIINTGEGDDDDYDPNA